MAKRKLNVEENTKMARASGRTHHQTGYHKRIKNPSTNYIGDPHKTFCRRCMAHNGRCPLGPRNMGACSL